MNPCGALGSIKRKCRGLTATLTPLPLLGHQKAIVPAVPVAIAGGLPHCCCHIVLLVAVAICMIATIVVAALHHCRIDIIASLCLFAAIYVTIDHKINVNVILDIRRVLLLQLQNV